MAREKNESKLVLRHGEVMESLWICSVIPAKAGIQSSEALDACFRGQDEPQRLWLRP
jgi:hypothetical protein